MIEVWRLGLVFVLKKGKYPISPYRWDPTHHPRNGGLCSRSQPGGLPKSPIAGNGAART
jgi:hypothetical protein